MKVGLFTGPWMEGWAFLGAQGGVGVYHGHWMEKRGIP